MRQSIIVAVLVALVAACAVNAQPEEFGPSPDVKVHHVFLERDGKHIPAGETIDVLLAVRNLEEKPINVSFAMGSIHASMDYNFRVQNFSGMPYNTQVQSQKEASFLFPFRPYHELPARSFILTLNLIYYSDDGQPHVDSFFNSTIDIIEPAKLIDMEVVMMYLMLTALIGAGGYVVVSAMSGVDLVKMMNQKPKRSAPVSQEARQDEWLSGTSYDLERKRKEKRSTRRKNE